MGQGIKPLPHFSYEGTMKIERHYVIFYSPGTFFTEMTGKSIEKWDVKTAVEMAKTVLERYNAKPYAFRFETFEEYETIIKNEVSFEAKPKKISMSGLYFLTGIVRSYDDVLTKKDLQEQILLSNMETREGMAYVIENRNSFLSTLPYEEDSKIVDWEGNVIDEGNSPERMKYRAEVKERIKAKWNST